jgi:putative transposase
MGSLTGSLSDKTSATDPLHNPRTLLVRNDVFTDEHGTHFRLVNVFEDIAWVINITNDNCWPRCCKYSTLVQEIELGRLVMIKTGVRRQLPFHSSAADARKRSAYEAIQPLILNEAIFDAKQRGPLVKQRAEEAKLSKTTINKYLKMYWAGGQTQDALLPSFPSIGMNKSNCTNGRGCPTRSHTIYQMKESDVENIKTAIETYYFKNETRTLVATHSKMLDEHYSYRDGNGDLYNKPLSERPSLRQFRHVFKRSYPMEVILRARKGEKDFARDHNQHLTGALHEAIGAGYMYEIDATIADVWLVAKANREKIIGKPTMYLIYDRYSRLCVGFYVGLESACWEAAMQAILSIAEDKATLCKKYRIPYDPSDFPADGIFPQKFLGDCGEMISRNSNRICDGMEGTVANASPLCPQSKGTVECGFKTTHVTIASITPGYDPPSNAKRRRGKHYENDACLTVDEFTAIILNAIIKHNRDLMKNYQAPPEIILRARPIPIELWNDSVTNQVGNLWRYSEDYLRLKLLPRSIGTIRREGIFFNGCYYSCPELEKKGWFISAANRGRSQISVSFDRRLVDAIVVYDPNDMRVAYRCKLTPRSIHFKGYSFAEVHYIVVKLKEIVQEDEQDDQQRRSDFAKNTAAITGPAYAAMKKVSQGKSRSSRKADTASERAAERTERRQTEAAIIPSILGVNRCASTCEVPGLQPNVVAMPGIQNAEQSNASNVDKEVSSTVDSSSDVRDTKNQSESRPISIEERLAQKRQELQREFYK